MTIDPDFMSSFLVISSGFLGAFIAALWIALILWTYRDIKARTHDRFVRLLATILVTILSLPGLLIYIIIRPHRTLEEEYQANLEEEALLRTIEDQLVCPGCGRLLKQDWMICPTCQTKVQNNCLECGKLLELSWTICPYCGKTIPGLREEIKKTETNDETIKDREEL